MKTILFSLATTETAGPSADVSVPTRKSTLSLRMSSRATRTASFASALESRTRSSILRPSTPPLALSSSTNIRAPFVAGSPNRAGGPDSGIGMPTLMGFWASAATGTRSTRLRSATRIIRRCIRTSFVAWAKGLSEDRTARHVRADPIERRGRGDEERSVVVVAPGKVRRMLRHLDDLEQVGVGVEDVDAPRAAAVHVADRVELHPIGCPGLVAFRLR